MISPCVVGMQYVGYAEMASAVSNAQASMSFPKRGSVLKFSHTLVCYYWLLCTLEPQ